MQRGPLSKVRREFGRAALRLWDAGLKPVRRLRTRLYDRRRAALVTVHDGQLPKADKVAVYVIFQPSGIQASTLVTCDWLARNGYAPLVVSNAAVSPADLQALLARSWLTVVRPNLGYDFGAYRDGLWVLSSREQAASRILLLNDSIWAPLTDDDRMLARLERQSSGLSGPVFVARPGRSRRNAHFQSYLVSLGGAVARHPALAGFWRHYPLCDARRVVLSEGEKGLTQAVLGAGLAQAPVPTAEVMFDRMQEQDAATLGMLLRYAAYDTAADAAEGRALVARDDGSEAWRQAALDHARRILGRAQPMGAFPVAGVLLMGFAFLKKGNNLPVYPGMRWQYLRAVRDGILPKPAPEILAEIEASRMDGRWTSDPDCSAPP